MAAPPQIDMGISSNDGFSDDNEDGNVPAVVRDFVLPPELAELYRPIHVTVCKNDFLGSHMEHLMAMLTMGATTTTWMTTATTMVMSVMTMTETVAMARSMIAVATMT